MKLTPEEEKVIKEMRKKAEAEKPFREAFLKHDLYDHDSLDRESDFSMENPFKDEGDGFPQMSADQKDKIIALFIKGFKKILNKGDRFVSYVDDGEELWYDYVGYGIEGVGEDWAKANLENFKNLR